MNSSRSISRSLNCGDGISVRQFYRNTKVYKVNPIHMIAMAGFAGLLLLY